MSETFHPGEVAVQERVGEASGAAVYRSIPEIAADFLVTRPALVLAGRGEDGRMWATMLTGRPGFMQTPDPRVMVVDGLPRPDDPLAALVAHGGEVGSILWDHHGRMRVNGVLEPRAGGFAIHTVQVYSNCGRYIAERHPVESAGNSAAPSPAIVTDRLTDAQMTTIREANTFFIGSSHPDGPADASHRGGNPGFVLADSAASLRWPDYNGNRMFMTLGNITLNPSVGLLFPNWDTGGLLQVSGRAAIDWNPAATAGMPGAERVVTFAVDAVRETAHALPTHWSAARLSRYNPRALVETA
jgi:predicted pyridoxine 5'-phosphate oxidase superfamily flavin-nucleotide-binding protein